MMKNEMKTNNKTVLLAIVAVFAMIAAGAAVVMISSETEAAPEESAVCTVLSVDSKVEAGSYYVASGTVKVSADAPVDGVLIYVAKNAAVTVTENVTASVYSATAFSGDKKATYDAAEFAITNLNGTTSGVTVKFTNDNRANVSGNATSMTIGVAETVTADPSVTVAAAAVANIVWAGAMFYDEDTETVSYCKAAAESYTLNNVADTLTIKSGNTTVMGGASTVQLISDTTGVFKSTAGMAFTYPASVLTAAGTINQGFMKVTEGTLTPAGAKIIGENKVIGTTTTAYDEGYAAPISYALSSASYIIIGDYVLPDKTTKITYDVTIAAGAKLTVPEKNTIILGDKTVEAAGDEIITLASAASVLDVWGTLKGVDGATALVIPTVTSAAAANVYLRYGSTVTNIHITGNTVTTELPALDKLAYISGTIKTDSTLEDMVLNDDLTIAEGVTVNVNGMLSLDGHKLTVEGTLIVNEAAQIGADSTEAAYGVNTIELGAKGKLTNNGFIAMNLPIIIGKSNASKVSIAAVTGLEFAYSKDGLVVNGEPTAMLNVNAAETVTMTGVRIKSMEVPAGVTITGSATITGALTVEGKYTGAVVTMVNDSYLDVPGTLVGAITAQITDVGDDQPKAKAAAGTAVLTSVVGTDKHAGLAISGYTISVIKTPYVDEDENEMYYQRAYISGDLVLSGTPLSAGDPGFPTLTMSDGEFFVPVLGELKQSVEGVVIAGETLVVEGTFTSSSAIGATWVGGGFSVGTGTGTIYTVAGYNAAIDAVAEANTKTVTLHGLAGYEIPLLDDVIILDKEIIASDGAASIVVPEGVVLYVMNGGSFDADIIKAIDGKVVVEKSGTCNPDAGLYQVESEDAEGTVTYCGFQTALNEAEAGDTISITGAVAKMSSLTVPAGVTLQIESTGSIIITKTIVVPAGAEFIVNGALTFGTNDTRNAKITVAGSMDISDGTIVLNDYTGAGDEYKMQISSTGELTYRAVQVDGIVLNGAVYTVGTKNVLTTIENALEEGATTINIAGDYESSEIIELGTAKLIVEEDAVLKIAAIVVEGGSIDASAGDVKLTTVVSGTSGTDDDVGVSLKGFNGVIEDKLAAGKYTFDITQYNAGSVTIVEGTAVLSDALALVGEKDAFIVASGATLQVAADAGIDNDGIFTVDGTLEILEDGSLDIFAAADAITLVSGSVEVAKGAALTTEDIQITGSVIVSGTFTLAADKTMEIYGSFYVDDSEDNVAGATFNGNVYVGASDIGAGASLSGKKVSTAATKFIVAFPGAEVAESSVKDFNWSVFLLNGVEYCTAYAEMNDAMAIGATGVITKVIPIAGYDMTGMYPAADPKYANWTDLLGTPIAAATNKIGTEAFCFGGVAKTANVKVSVATGMSIYVDGVKYPSGETIPGMSMGAHTVAVTVNPGYKYADGTTATVTFDGKVLSGILAFTITTDMADKTLVLSAIGDIVVDQPDYPEQEKEDNSMIMILLAVLVVMVVILAIVTVIRMMRS